MQGLSCLVIQEIQNAEFEVDIKFFASVNGGTLPDPAGFVRRINTLMTANS